MTEKRKIYFRADAGPEIGYGHYIRSLALADMLKQDFDCTMFTQAPTDYQLREAEEVCNVVALPSNDSRFEKFLDYLTGEEIVVLDNYFFTTDYQRAIKAKGCKLVCIDDMHDKHYVADVVINHGVNDDTLYKKEDYTHLCLGVDYALLRKPFLNVNTSFQRKPGTFVICFGGADPLNLTKHYIDLLINCQQVLHIVAVVGDGYQYMDSLKIFPNIDIRQGLSAHQMAELFMQSEAVVCSASTTCYEALACGAKVYAGWYIDNQKDFYHHLCTLNAIISLSNLQESQFEFDTKAETKGISFATSKYNLRKIFWQLSLRQVNYISLTESESRQVWQTRNLPEIRQWMFNTEPFTWEEHSIFVASLKQRNDRLYIAFFCADQLVASYDMIDIHDGNAECGLYLHPDYEGKGIASMIEEIMEENARLASIHTITSQVLKKNEASLRFLMRNGFKESKRNDNVIFFQKNI